jgi:hypothetical protein
MAPAGTALGGTASDQETPFAATRSADASTPSDPAGSAEPADIQSRQGTTVQPLEEKKAERPRFVSDGDGTLFDTHTHLVWTANDNGEDITWHQADAYCRQLGMRLPTLDELASLYDPGVVNPNPVTGGCRAGVSIHPAFHLTCCCPWASEVDGSKAAFFGFNGGYRHWYGKKGSDGSRVLCVRPRSGMIPARPADRSRWPE